MSAITLGGALGGAHVFTIDGAQLGDVICFAYEGRAAQQAMIRMNALFQGLGKPAQFAASVAAVNAEWDYDNHWYRDWMFCGAKAIGQRAEHLAQQMDGTLPVDPNLAGNPLNDFLALGIGLAKIAAAGLVVWGGFKLYHAARGARFSSRALSGWQPRRAHARLRG